MASIWVKFVTSKLGSIAIEINLKFWNSQVIVEKREVEKYAESFDNRVQRSAWKRVL